MRILCAQARILAGVVLLAAATVGFAGPARAAQVMEGVYDYHQEGLPAAAWTIYPICVPTVGDLREELRLPVACTLHVTGTPPAVVSGGDAKLTGGQWSFTVNKKDALTCPDGSTEALTETYRFDDATMSGTRTVIHNQVCGLDATMDTTPFTLTYREPLPIPVQKYPLYCEPGGLRRCF